MNVARRLPNPSKRTQQLTAASLALLLAGAAGEENTISHRHDWQGGEWLRGVEQRNAATVSRTRAQPTGLVKAFCERLNTPKRLLADYVSPQSSRFMFGKFDLCSSIQEFRMTCQSALNFR